MCASSRPDATDTANASGELSFSDSDDAGVPHHVGDSAADEADEVIGVSMGYVQSRLKSRLTPAEEKTRIMERNGSYFGDEPGLFAPDITEEPESLTDDFKPPPPEPAASKETGRSSFTRSLLKSTLPLRPRAWSGDSHTSAHRSLKKFFPSLHLRTGSLTLSQRRSRSMSSRLNLDQDVSSPFVSSPDSPALNGMAAPAEDPIGELKPLEAPSAKTPGKYSFIGSNPALRRSSSDQSLYLRASSTASSLEHRPQYEHIHSQTNSRFKAIKDTLQDSSSRLLSMPSLHLQDLRSDWGYKQFLSDASHHRTATTTTANESFRSATTAPSFETRALPDDPSAALPRTRSPRSSVATTYPILSEAMSELTGDVVVMGGYRGSILRSAKPPQRQLWVPMKVGLNLRKVDLEVGLNHEDEERMEETIIPDGVLSHVGPVDICRRLLKRLQKCENAVRGDLRVWNYGYDWRLSPHLLSKRLIKYLEGLPCNAPDVPPHKRGAYVIAHSLGGLITRHAVNHRPELFAGVLYAGVPQHCVNILGPLRNGDDVLLSSRVLTAQVNFTFRTSFALLPEQGQCFIDKRTKEEYRLDFFSPDTWDEYRLSPCIKAPLPVPPASSSSRAGSLNLMDKNLPTIRKRFSNILSSTSTSISTDDTDLDSNISNTFKPTSLAPALDGLLEPATNPKGSSPTSPNTQPITLPYAAAKSYLERTLHEIKTFKSETLFNPSHQESNAYPPFSILYSKSIPTVYGARVASREAIKFVDAYDDLAFAAGDGVCLASAAMLPEGYKVIRGGMVKSEKGHVGLLGDLEGVGACLKAMVRGRREGVGLGIPSSAAPSASSS